MLLKASFKPRKLSLAPVTRRAMPPLAVLKLAGRWCWGTLCEPFCVCLVALQ
jgi:hypothetical protein